MRTIILTAIAFFFFFANSAKAQMIVNDSTKTTGIKLVQMEDGDPILIVYNMGQMTLEQLEAAAQVIEEEIEATQNEIYTLAKCNVCQDGIPALRERIVNDEKLLIAVDLEISKKMNEKKITKNK